jgi:hypothetical protein
VASARCEMQMLKSRSVITSAFYVSKGICF